ncbi:glycoside hydrolase [Xylanimonas oleitrophica]|uniref:Glycoside hydrolase n=1 Tax=Xylanimonas oleitrophica TaxID=2607479 RepID=A0A2W5WSQ6_9MICO|nr:glycoside hydrolase [Xylanimonas oleitrophica]
MAAELAGTGTTSALPGTLAGTVPGGVPGALAGLLPAASGSTAGGGLAAALPAAAGTTSLAQLWAQATFGQARTVEGVTAVPGAPSGAAAAAAGVSGAAEAGPVWQPAAPTSDVAARGQQVVATALEHVGTPYVWGGSTPAGFDCSGLVSYAYAKVGVDLPHQSTAIRDSARTTVVSREEALPGDIIWSPGHVSVYMGDGMQVEASRPGGWDVAVRKIWQQDPVFLRVV